MTVSQILVENVNVISIEISFLEEQDLSISLVRHQKISCYVDATLQDATYDARTIIHVGVSDILNNQESRSNGTVDKQLERDNRKMQIVWRKACFCFRIIAYLKNKRKFVGWH